MKNCDLGLENARPRAAFSRPRSQFFTIRTSQRRANNKYIFPNFQNFVRCEKDLKNNKHSSLYFGRKYARIFVFGHFLFIVAHSSLSENCSLLGTDNVRGHFRAKWRLLFIYSSPPNFLWFLFNQWSVSVEEQYRLIVAPRKFDVFKTNMLVWRTSNFQGATITPIVPRHPHSVV